jgi:N-acetylglutamate synthase-like GNAT family acetyltransferase
MLTRKATLEDLPQLSNLFDQYRNFYHKESDIDGAENFLKERLENQDSEIFVAEENGILTGFTQLYPLFSSTRMKRYWLLNDLFVNGNHRGKGHSKALIESAKELCRETKSVLRR